MVDSAERFLLLDAVHFRVGVALLITILFVGAASSSVPVITRRVYIPIATEIMQNHAKNRVLANKTFKFLGLFQMQLAIA